MNRNLISLLGQQAALLFVHHPSLAPAHQTNDYFFSKPGAEKNDYIFL